MGNRPKELGFPWEIGVPEDHLRIDDGLGAEYFLPVELCETPEVLFPFYQGLWFDDNCTQSSRLTCQAFFGVLELKYELRFPDYRKFSKATFCFGSGTNDI